MFLAAELNGKRLKYKQGEYSLTFDDGPTEGVTAGLARFLRQEEISATFFVLGERANDEALSEMTACGHRIGNHTYSHQNLCMFAGDHRIEIADQIGRCHERVARFNRQRIPFRAPGGAWTPEFTKIANGLSFADRYIGRYGWDIDTSDWRLHRKKGNGDKIEIDEFRRRFEQAIDRVNRGVILLHDGFPGNEAHLADRAENQVMKATEFVVETMHRRGLRLVPLKEPSTWF